MFNNIDTTEFIQPEFLKSKLPAKLWSKPDMKYDADMNCDNILAFYYDSVEYKNIKTKVFAYIGYPENASETNKVPAVVLVHGGLGTAYAQWVKQWNNKGFAAIAMDLEGCAPVYPGAETAKKHLFGGLSNTGLSDINNDLTEQWMYQCICNVILANSILREDSKIDSSKIGINGISWGAFITSIVIGVDGRFSFAIAVYGSGYLKGTLSNFGRIFANDKINSLWEPSKYFKSATTPVLWINGDSDFHFAPTSTSESFKNTKAGYLSILHDFTHSQWDGTVPAEIYSFAVSIVNNKEPFIRIIEQPTNKKYSLRFNKPYGISVTKAELHYTKDEFAYSASECITQWETLNATFDTDIVSFNVPSNYKYYYVSICDNRGLQISSVVVTKL